MFHQNVYDYPSHIFILLIFIDLYSLCILEPHSISQVYIERLLLLILLNFLIKSSQHALSCHNVQLCVRNSLQYQAYQPDQLSSPLGKIGAFRPFNGIPIECTDHKASTVQITSCVFHKHTEIHHHCILGYTP